jgi:proline racemase
VQEPIIRTYRGASRADAERAYQADATQARAAGFEPLSHRWTRDWDGHTLSVAYGQSGVGPGAETQARTDSQDAAAVSQPQRADQPARAANAASDTPVAPTGPPAPTASPARDDQPSDEPARAGRRARLTVQVVDMHCAGEPLRMIRSGYPDVPHLPVLERRRWVEQNADHIRRAIVNEPRGHRDMYGAILLPPHGAGADVCLLFMHNEGYSTMCGHGVIAVTTALIEEGLVPATEPVTTIRYEVPAGLVAASAMTQRQADGSHLVSGVRFTNVPSYLAAESLPVTPDGVALHGRAAQSGALSVDIGFGGAYYGIIDAADVGLRVEPGQAEELRRVGAAVTDVLRRDRTPSHPTQPDLSFVYGTIIIDHQPHSSPDGRAVDADMRNATVFADAELDRSPCGSGTSAILAQMFGRGRLQVGDEISNAGITGESFIGRIEGQTQLGPQPAIQTSVAGTAYLTGYATLLIDERDPLGEGFVLG